MNRSKEHFAGYYTLQRETRRFNLSLDDVNTGIHEGAHALTAKGIGVAVGIADATPQSKVVKGITRTAQSSLEKHMAIAMASEGLGGTGGDEGNADTIEFITGGRVTRDFGISVKNNVLSQYTHEEFQIFGEMLAERGAIVDSQISGLIFDARAEIRGIEEEKKQAVKEAENIVFESKTNNIDVERDKNHSRDLVPA